MKKKRLSEELKRELMDARDSLLGEQELEKLREKTVAHDPGLWEDFLWMREHGQPGAVFDELSAMNQMGPDEGMIARFHERRQSAKSEGLDLESLVWTWFRRYVLTAGLLAMMILVGFHWGEPGVTEANGQQQQLETYLGWDQQAEWTQEDFPDLDHWMYEDL